MTASAITPAVVPIASSRRCCEVSQDSRPIDRDCLLEQCLDSLSFALQMLDDFASTSPSRLVAFDAALAELNGAAIATQAHSFKGVAGVLAANALSEICSSLESAAKVDDWDQTRDLIQQLHQEAQRAIDFIPSIRESANA